MLDTVKIVVPRPDLGRVVRGLDRAEERTRLDTGEAAYTGRVGTLSVRASAARLSVRGSLSRFAGVPWPTRAELVEAIERLEDLLGQPLSEAQVWRLDLFADLSMNEPPAAYFPLLLVKPRFQRVGYDGTSVGFQCDRRSVRFYDKEAERGRAFRPTSGPLRFEVAWLKAVAKQLGAPVTVADLSRPAFWRRLVSEWVEEYRSIEKARSLIPLEADAPTLKLHLAAMGLQRGGIGEVLRGLDAGREAGTISPRFYQRRRRYFLDLASDPRFTERPARLDELDAAVERAAETMRNRSR